MPQKVITAIDLTLPGNGEATVLGPFNINPNWTEAYVQLKRCSTANPQFWANPLTQIDVGIFLSIAGGEFYRIGGFGADGGIHIDEDGNELDFLDYSTTGLRDGPQRRVQIVMIVNGPDAFVSQADLTVR